MTSQKTETTLAHPVNPLPHAPIPDPDGAEDRLGRQLSVPLTAELALPDI